jgi:NAD(P)H-hydrate epimerase
MKPEPTLTRDEVRAIDRRAIEDYGLPGVVLMENAGRGAAELLLVQGIHGPVLICCGGGNNGGDGYVIARHLDIAGIPVRILALVPPEELSGDAATQAAVIRRCGVPILVLPQDGDAVANELAAAEWIVDALLGTGMRGNVRPPYDDLIDAINRAPGKVLAVDLPSGLDCDLGVPLGSCIRADLTTTFVARKRGFNVPTAAPYLGQVHVIGIGAPRDLIEDSLSRAAAGPSK